MSTAGILILLLIAFLVLHRWYIRPHDKARRMQAAQRAGARPAPADDPSRQPALRSQGDGAPGAGLMSGQDGSGGGNHGSGGGGHGSDDGD